jgi:hypothetical protein
MGDEKNEDHATLKGRASEVVLRPLVVVTVAMRWPGEEMVPVCFATTVWLDVIIGGV